MKQRKNIVLVITHDLGQHIEPYGVSTVQTPNLHRMALEGTLFEKNFCTSPGCSPSRAALFTGRYPHSTGVMGLTHSDFLWRLHADEKHLAQILAENGYDTCLVGNWHENNRIDNVGYQKTVLQKGDSYSLCDNLNENDPKPSAADVAKRAGFYLSCAKESPQPFFLSVGIFEPHRPFHFGGCVPDTEKGVWIPPYIPQETPGQKAAAEIEFGRMQGAIRSMDRAVGDLLERIEEHGLKDETLVLFTSDHGIAMPRAKCSLYDPGIETPLILWGGGIPGNVRRQELVSNVDYLPTLLEWAGLPIPDSVQGQSVLPCIFDSSKTVRSEIFAEKTYHRSYDPIRCIRTDTYKYIINFDLNIAYDAPADVMEGEIFRENVSEYVRLRPRYELYDLNEDPWEQDNRAEHAGFSGVRAELHERLVAWMRETDDPLMNGPVPSVYYHQTMNDV